MSKITHNTIPNFGDPNKSEEEKKKDTMMAWIGMTSVNDLEKEDRKKFLDAISGVKKKASNPPPIPHDVVNQISNVFMRKLSQFFVEYGFDPVNWLQYRLSVSKQDYFNKLISDYTLEHEDVSGREVITSIIVGLDPRIKETIATTSIATDEYSQEYYGDNKKGKFVKIIIGNDLISKWINRVSKLHTMGATREELNNEIMGLAFRDIFRISSHELTHAFDLPTESESFRKEYEEVFDFYNKESREEKDRIGSFYYSTREELKAHINQSIAEASDFVNKYGLDVLLSMSFLQFLETSTDVYLLLKRYLTVYPGDEDKTIVGQKLSKRKAEAWKKYLRTMYTWWEDAVQIAKNELEQNINKESFNNKIKLRKQSRLNRRSFLIKTITKIEGL